MIKTKMAMMRDCSAFDCETGESRRTHESADLAAGAVNFSLYCAKLTVHQEYAPICATLYVSHEPIASPGTCPLRLYSCWTQCEAKQRAVAV